MAIADDLKDAYPDNWEAIREAILHRATYDAFGQYGPFGPHPRINMGRARPCCEKCYRPHGVELPLYKGGIWEWQWESPEGDIIATRVGPDGEVVEEWMQDYEPEPPRGPYEMTETVLTIAHLCQDPRCDSREHLRALCQRCHLQYDRQPAQKKRRERIYAELRGQTSLVESAGCEEARRG